MAVLSKPRNAAEWWKREADAHPSQRQYQTSRFDPIVLENTRGQPGRKVDSLAPPAKLRKVLTGATIGAARRAQGRRVKRIRQKFLPRQMLFLLSERIRREEFKKHGVQLHDVWKEFIWGEKMFPELVVLQRSLAAQKLRQLKRENQEEDQRLFDQMVPDHLRPVLATKWTRNGGMFKRLIEDMEWPDEKLWEEILGGFQTHGSYQNGEALNPDPKYTEAKGSLQDWLDLEIRYPDGAPTAWDRKTLQKLADEINEKLLSLNLITEVDPSTLICNPARCFPKVELKFDGTVKCRILVDERKSNEYRENQYKATLNGAKHHAAILEMFAAPLGHEEVGWVPADQSRKDLWLQCHTEMHRFEQEGVTVESKQILQEIRKTMRLVNRPKAVHRRYQRWTQSDLPCLRTSRGFLQSGTLGGCPGNPTGTAEFVDMGTKDWSGAYYQVGVARPDLNPITWWDPQLGRWRYALASILNMGSKFSVPSWCRVANFVEAAAARYGRMVAPIYIDDAALFGLNKTIDSGILFYETLSEVLGLELSAKADANQESKKNDRARLLGLDYVFNREAGTITVEIPDTLKGKVADTGKRILNGIRDENVDRKDIERLVGGLTFVACASGTRAGMELIRPLHEWCREETFAALIRSDKWRAQLRLVVKSVLHMLDHPKHRVIGKREQRKLFLLVTDASGADEIENEDGSKSRATPWLGAMLWTPNGDVLVTRTEQPNDIETNIAVLEARAVAMGIKTWGDLIQGADVLVYLDNQNAAYNFVRAGGKNPATAKIATGVALWGYAQATRFFYQYIRTDLNPADALTRESWEDLAEFLPAENVWTPNVPPDGALGNNHGWNHETA